MRLQADGKSSEASSLKHQASSFKLQAGGGGGRARSSLKPIKKFNLYVYTARGIYVTVLHKYTCVIMPCNIL